MLNSSANFSQRWAKVMTLRALTIFLEALFQLEKRLGGWTVGLTVKKRLIFYSSCFNLNFKTFIFKKHHFLRNPIFSLTM
jgi:hypothetical protein